MKHEISTFPSSINSFAVHGSKESSKGSHNGKRASRCADK